MVRNARNSSVSALPIRAAPRALRAAGRSKDRKHPVAPPSAAPRRSHTRRRSPPTRAESPSPVRPGLISVGLLPSLFNSLGPQPLTAGPKIQASASASVQQLHARRWVTHTGGARPAGASVVRTSSRAAEMQKKVRAQRALLGGGGEGSTGGPGDPGGAMALGYAGHDPGGLLSPVSSIGVKLDSLHHWNGTPGAPAGHPAAIDGARVPNSAMIERARLAEPSSMSLSFSPGTAEQAHELRPSGYYPPTTVAPATRGNVERDLEPVRSNDGMSFADMLARNGGANPSRTQPPSRAAPLTRNLPDFQFSTFELSLPTQFSTRHFPSIHLPARRLTLRARLPQATPPRSNRSIQAPSARRPRSADPNPRSPRRPTPPSSAEWTRGTIGCARQVQLRTRRPWMRAKISCHPGGEEHWEE